MQINKIIFRNSSFLLLLNGKYLLIKSRVVVARIQWNKIKQSIWIRINNLNYIYYTCQVLKNIWIWFKSCFILSIFILDWTIFVHLHWKIIFQLFIEKALECTQQTNSENLTKSANVDLNKNITQEFFEESHNKYLGSESAFGNCFLWPPWDHWF